MRKEETVKKPVQPKTDHSQGENLLVRLLNKIFSGGSPLIEEWKPSKHGDSKRCQNSTNFIRKIRAKKKRKRKIRKRTQRHSSFPNKSMIRI